MDLVPWQSKTLKFSPSIKAMNLVMSDEVINDLEVPRIWFPEAEKTKTMCFQKLHRLEAF